MKNNKVFKFGSFIQNLNENLNNGFDVLPCILGLTIHDNNGMVDYLNKKGQQDVSEFVLNLESLLYSNKDNILFRLKKELGGETINSIKFKILKSPDVGFDIVDYFNHVGVHDGIVKTDCNFNTIDLNIFQDFFRCDGNLEVHELELCFSTILIISVLYSYESELKKQI